MTQGSVPVPVDLGSVSLADVVAYAGASGDRNPLHFDAEVARAAGHTRLFSMGALPGAWLLSHLIAETSESAPTSGYSVAMNYQQIVPLNAPISVTSVRNQHGAEGTLMVAGKPAIVGSVSWQEPSVDDIDAENIQTGSIVVELGSVRRLSAAVRWPFAVGPDQAVPATWVASVAWWLEQSNPVERVGFEMGRALAGGTQVDHHGPRGIRVGETLEVREFVTNRRTKEGRRGRLDLADVVTQLIAEDGLRVTYRNTFVQLPAEEPSSDVPGDPETFRLRGSRDPSNGEVYYPERELSVDGRLRQLEPVDLSTSGVLHAFTTYEGQAYGQIDLPEGVRVQAKLAGEAHQIGGSYDLVTEDGKDWWFSRA